MPHEARAVTSLTVLYMFRMLGLFMLSPVLSIYASQFSGSTPFLVGLAFGIYGLAQATLQIPFGIWSERTGRKPIIATGLTLLIAGSVVAARAHSIYGVIFGRLLQGSGAVGGVLMALVADLTSEQNRTKAMAAIGASIGVSFGLAMILGSLLTTFGGVPAIFWATALLAASGLAILFTAVPTPDAGTETSREVRTVPELLGTALANAMLRRLNVGIFVLHLVLMSNFLVLPVLLRDVVGLPGSEHWKIYLPLMFFSFVAMVPAMIVAEKRQQVKPVFTGAVAILALTMFALAVFNQSKTMMLALYFIFFIAFNLLEAMLPSLVSKTAPAGARGTAMGIYSTSQFLGLGCGGALGGLVLQASHAAPAMLYVADGIIALLWFVYALGMAKPQPLKNLSLALKDIDDGISARLLAVSGVKEVLVVAEQRRAYLKVNEKELDRAALDTFTA